LTITPLSYKLHNRLLNIDLKHPKFGLWNTKVFSEALEMRNVCKEYLRTIGLDDISKNIIIKTVETNEEVC
jgi:hypothetical protein